MTQERTTFSAGMMNLLDPLAIPNPSKCGPKDIEGFYERRFKEDVAAEIAAHFPERILVPLEAGASLPERALHDALNELSLEMDSGRRKGDVMFKTTLVRSLLSSPAAFIETVRGRLSRLETADCHRLPQMEDARNISGNQRQSAVKESSRQSAVSNPPEWQAPVDECSRIGPGGAGVGTFMGTLEKECGNAIAAAGGKRVVLSPEGFHDRWHPGRQYVKYCAEGRMLFLSLWPPMKRCDDLGTAPAELGA